ncbi:KTSC domain-containing protein [Limnohabitans sp. 2KL-17]|uniref:KTSC domain-containing protein n=1 Tax=Limnohabitans sp. 2KL-17 TaxID=1100704 RepID=UPI000D3BA361|nr:KTSC domain-containing protein [Limnohabitans sp. 2KL-17]PUE56401.1 KTSC domain-containing protein [Limnohabitans sp. 2KL-17]
MEMITISSSNIAAVGYDEDSQTLQVEFNNGTRYQYFDVPEQVFIELKNAGSPGGYFASSVKGVYRFSRV